MDLNKPEVLQLTENCAANLELWPFRNIRAALWTRMLAIPLMPSGYKNNQEPVPNRSIFYSSCTHLSINSGSQNCINTTTLLPSHPSPSIYRFLRWVQVTSSSNLPVFLIFRCFFSVCLSFTLHVYKKLFFCKYFKAKTKHLDVISPSWQTAHCSFLLSQHVNLWKVTRETGSLLPP